MLKELEKFLNLLVDILHVSVLLQKYSLLILYPKCACATFEINMHESASKQQMSKIEYARIFGDNGPIIYTCMDAIS